MESFYPLGVHCAYVGRVDGKWHLKHGGEWMIKFVHG